MTDVCQMTLLQTPKATEQRNAGFILSLGSYSLAPPSGGVHIHTNKPQHIKQKHIFRGPVLNGFCSYLSYYSDFSSLKCLGVRNHKVRDGKLGGMIPNLTHHLGNRNDIRWTF